jgi:lipid-A-disaccharide synthase
MPDLTAPSFAMVAGEASGDMLAGLLLQGLRQRWPQANAHGIGGPRMAEQGFEAWWPHERLAVRGYVEVLRHYRGIVAIRRELCARLLANPPAIFVGVDAPDFNLDLERQLLLKGVPTVHFVCPSVWAWRANRLEKIRQSVRHMLCIFPFEPALLSAHGIASTYVGHPFAATIPMHPDKAAARQQLNLPQQATVVSLLPGSRASEIDQLAPVFLQAAAWLQKREPDLHFVLPTFAALRPRLQACIDRSGGNLSLTVTEAGSHLALAACDVSLVASGTATLEAALFKRPMVIAYRMNPLSWQIMRRQKLQPWVGLPNILAAEFLVPEFLQDQAKPEALGQAVLGWLNQAQRVAHLQQRFVDMHHSLLRDTAQLATDAIEQTMAR